MGKKPDGGESAAAKTRTAVGGGAAFGLTLTALPGAVREANGFGNEWKPGGLPEPNQTEPAGETGFAAHPLSSDGGRRLACGGFPAAARLDFLGGFVYTDR